MYFMGSQRHMISVSRESLLAESDTVRDLTCHDPLN